MVVLQDLRHEDAHVLALELLVAVPKELLGFKVGIYDVANVSRCHCDGYDDRARVVAEELVLVHVVQLVHVVRGLQVGSHPLVDLVCLILIIHHVSQEVRIDPLEHDVVREQPQHLLGDLIHLRVRGGDLDAKVVDAVHIQPLVHQLLPEIETVVCSVDNLLLEADEGLLEIVDLDHV